MIMPGWGKAYVLLCQSGLYFGFFPCVTLTIPILERRTLLVCDGDDDALLLLVVDNRV